MQLNNKFTCKDKKKYWWLKMFFIFQMERREMLEEEKDVELKEIKF